MATAKMCELDQTARGAKLDVFWNEFQEINSEIFARSKVKQLKYLCTLRPCSDLKGIHMLKIWRRYCEQLLHSEMVVPKMKKAISKQTKIRLCELQKIVENRKNSRQCKMTSNEQTYDWVQHENLCILIVVLKEKQFELNYLLCFRYLSLLVNACSNMPTVNCALSLLSSLPKKNISHKITPVIVHEFVKNQIDSVFDSNSIAKKVPKNNNYIKRSRMSSKLFIFTEQMLEYPHSRNYKKKNRDFCFSVFAYFESVIYKCLRAYDIEGWKRAALALERWFGDKSVCQNNPFENERKFGNRVANLSDLCIQVISENAESSHIVSSQIQLKVNTINQSPLDKENALARRTAMDWPYAVILSQDRMLARSASAYFATVRSMFPVEQRSNALFHFYECTLHSSGMMQIGWTTGTEIFSQYTGVGDNRHSIGLDGFRCSLRHCGKYFNYRFDTDSKDNDLQWTSGDIVGCAINLQNRDFCFYLNGHKIISQSPFDVHFSRNQPYYPAASLDNAQEVYFNFGQNSFKYPPREFDFISIHQAAEANPERYRLCESILIRRNCQTWFKVEPILGDFQRFFPHTSRRQQKYNNWIKRIRMTIEQSPQTNLDYCLPMTLKRFEFLRFFQSLIEVTDPPLISDVAIFGNWIETMCVLERASFHRLVEGKFCEFLYSYLKLELADNPIRNLNLCLVLHTILQRDIQRHNPYPKMHRSIQKTVFDYFLRIIDLYGKSKIMINRWTLLLALLGLGTMKLIVLRLELKSRKIVAKIKSYTTINQMGQINARNSVDRQLATAAHRLLVSIGRAQNPKDKNQNSTQTLLNFSDKSKHMHMSPTLLSARSNANWQNVRSQFSVSSDMHYFEVTLLTAGPMHIGWATKPLDIRSFRPVVAPPSEHVLEFAVTFDGFTQGLWSQGMRQSCVNRQNRWKVGDIVGCLVDFTKKCLQFSLNGQWLEFSTVENSGHHQNVFFSTDLPYYAMLSLGSYQQCTVNFGQTEFCFPPVQADFRDLHYLHRSKWSKRKESKNQFVSFKRTKITNSVLLVNSQFVVYGDFRLNGNRSGSADSNSTCQICEKTNVGPLLQFVGCDQYRFCNDCFKNDQINLAEITSRMQQTNRRKIHSAILSK